MKKYIMGMDQGTTGTKVILVDYDSNIVGSAYSEFTQHFPQPGYVEHDAEEIWDVSMKVAAEAMKKGNVKPEELAGIGITNQRETSLFWDKATSKPACRAQVWQDTRTIDIVEELGEKGGAELVARTGMVIVTNCAATKIIWMLRNDPAVQEGVKQKKLLWGTIDSWMVWKLSGGQAHITDHSNQSVTLMQNARTLEWDEWLLDTFDIPREVLPEIRGSAEVFAYTDPDAFFGVKIPIAGVAGDQQAATFGQACVQPGMAKNTYGTGAFMVVNTGDYVEPGPGVFCPALWTINGKTTFGIEGLANVCGAVVQWLRDGLNMAATTEEIAALAETVPDNGGVYFVPAFAGLGAPYLDGYARGTMFGITRGTTSAHVAKAAIESMAFQIRDILGAMENMSGVKLKALRVDGGAVKNDSLMQFQADILGIPVDRPVVMETTVLGAAYLAGIATGFWKDLNDLSDRWRLERRFEPKMSADQRDTMYARWKDACKRSVGWMKQPE
jgi:glycerol kinase